MNTKFFTNQDANTLLHKLEGIFEYKKIHFFDALVGYFRASGYFQIRPFIEKTAEIRILVGIEVDKLVYEASQQGLLFDPNAERSQEEFYKELRTNIQTAKYDKKVEAGMYQFIEDIASKKIQLRIHPSKRIHAKIYIFREAVKHEHGYGSVITGSSNLSDAGLKRNFEFNVELRDNSDIEFATETFEALWNESVDIQIEDVVKIKQETYLNDTFTPYEVYLKFLLEYFGTSIDFNPNSVGDLPKGFKKLSYQVDAVNDGFLKLTKHGGFFLADVVGLGKTVVAALIAKRFFYTNDFPSHISKTLIIIPPVLRAGWEDTLTKFKLDNYHIVSNGSLHKVRHPEQYDLIIVDEAHKFRSDSAEMYNQLQKLCKTETQHRLQDGTLADKKVILISATPLNNRPEDIANLVYLFQDSKSSTLEVTNLQRFFRTHIDSFNKQKKVADSIQVNKTVKTIYEDIRKVVIEPLTVRRTRTDLIENEAYSEDLLSQGITFPKIETPSKIFYQLDEVLDPLYDKTLAYLTRGEKRLNYFRYMAIKYLVEDKKRKYAKADLISTQLAKIMKTLLVKRIDSSFYAFTQSLERYAQANRNMLKMFENGVIFIAPNLKVNEYIENGKEEELMELVLHEMENDPTIEICSPDDFEPQFLDGLVHDQEILDELVAEWETVKDNDPKLKLFIEYLKTELFDTSKNLEGKLVVFSESKETTEYLNRELNKAGFKKIICVEGSNKKELMPIIRENFDANFAHPKNDYDIVISTEVLAEGVNLHRSNMVVNYDTPWNSTRLMQRIGRVNRIGSKAKSVFIYNFFPTTKVEQDIELEKKAKMKLAAFHAALGEDSQIYSPEEEYETFGLFDKNMEEERDEKLRVLLWLREQKEQHPELIKRIKKMPFRARVGRKSKTLKGGTITFIRNNKRDLFLYINADGSIEELSFMETVKEFEAKIDEKAIPLHAMHHDQVSKALEEFGQRAESEKSTEKKIDTKMGPNEAKAQVYLDGFLPLSFLSDTEKELILKAKRALLIGRFQNLQRDINNLKKAVKKAPLIPTLLLEELLKILNNYPLQEVDEYKKETAEIAVKSVKKEIEPEIIISESFNVENI